MKQTSETAFENAIESVLLASGFERHPFPEFDRERAIFPAVALRFTQTTQKPVWEKLATLHENTSERVIAALGQKSRFSYLA